MKYILKLFKIFFAILLVPLCIGAAVALWQVIVASDSPEKILFASLAGAIVWFFIFIFLPEPAWLYVLGHELTHVLWSVPFGGKLKRIRVASDGGHVLLTKSNFLTSLAPYFFPFYVVLIIIVFGVGNYFFDWAGYILVFYFLIGMMYAFHITLTYRILKTKQPDIVGQGYIFAFVIIFLGNMLVLLIGIPFLTGKISISASLQLWLTYTLQVFHYLSHYVAK